MKYITKGIKFHLLLAISAIMILSACNKALEQIPAPVVVAPTGSTLGETIATIADDSLYYKLIVRGGMLTTINNRALTFTMFVPNNAAMRQFINAISGGLVPINAPDPVFVGFINTNIPVASAASIVNYNMISQAITTASIPNTFPNFFYPTNLNPTTGTPGFNPLVRLLTFPSTRNGNWVNNIPLVAVNNVVANGVIHTAAALPAPPTKVLWQRIATDPDMTYLAAAIQRADSGVAPTTSASLVWAMSNFGPNLTVFAPTNAAFQTAVFGLAFNGYLKTRPMPYTAADTVNAIIAANGAVAAGPAFLGTNNVSTQTIKALVVYHIMGTRAFTNNFPTTATAYPTLLSGQVPVPTNVTLVCTFTGLSVTAASVKGNINPTAANILINPTPEPNGTSDQFFVNGILHKINQVLIPLPL